MTPDSLNTYTKKKLTTLARSRGVSGVHSLRKEELIAAILTTRASTVREKSPTELARGSKPGSARPRPAADGQVTRRTTSSRPSTNRTKSAAVTPSRSSKASRTLKAGTERGPDLMDLKPLDRHWVQIRWQLSAETLLRARTALDWEFHGARPILRLFDITEQDERQSAAVRVLDIELDGDVASWCLQVPDPTRTYAVHLGLLAAGGRLHVLVRSRPLMMPNPGTVAALLQPEDVAVRSQGGAADADLDDEPRQWTAADLTPMQLKNLAAARASTPPGETTSAFRLTVASELLLHGVTHPEAALTLLGKKATVGSDGRFQLRMKLPPGRHVIPAVAMTPDGAEERTYVLAVEVTARELEPRLIEEVPR